MWQQIKKLQKRFSKNKNFIDDISFKVVAVSNAEARIMQVLQQL
jgi:hypothetical protein